jgi:TPR repeat protein
MTRLRWDTRWLALSLLWFSASLSATKAASAQAAGLQIFYDSAVEALERGDTAQALNAFRVAAEGGHPQAQFELAFLHYFDIRRGDQREAVRWFRRAADQGHPRAQYMLGGFYPTEVRWSKTSRRG